MSRHTKGPWEVRAKNPGIVAPVGRPLHIVANCDVLPLGPKTVSANARLVAAAPELLDALEWLVEECTNGDGSGTVGAIGAARAVIAKARAAAPTEAGRP